MDAYAEFLARKAISDPSTGMADIPPLPQRMFPFQRDIVAWALRRGRAALFAGTGLGKSFMELAWADAVHRETGRDILHLAPLAVTAQMVREADKFGMAARQVRTQADVMAGTNITNYQKLEHFDLSRFGGVILDECFAKGTLVDTPFGRKHIEDLQIGDQILNCVGVDVISDTHQREVPYAVMVTISGASFVSSPNHPIFTQRGWVGAQHLRSGDYALATGASMRLVRNDLRAKSGATICAAVLRDVLLSEMADVSEGNIGSCSLAGGGGQTGRQKAGVASVWKSGSTGRTGTDNQSQPYGKSDNKGESVSNAQGHASRTIRAWGKWSRDDICASLDDGCSWARMGSGISVITGPEKARIPDMLQSRLRESETEGRNRGGWRDTQRPSDARKGCEARQHDPFVRVDGIEILKPADCRLDKFRDDAGKLYFYDLGATRHPSYSVNGVLVHNSSILKNETGHYRNALVQACASIPFRLAATATPAPNDYMELGSHAEFLGVMSYTDMLATFFTHDGGETQKWRLKGHAENDFWRWMASWSVMLRKPSDLGYDDTGYDLPPLRLHQHTVGVDIAAANEAGFLFAMPAETLAERQAARRDTIKERVAKAAEIAPPAGQSALWWCNLNAESEALAKAIPGAVELRGSDSEDEKERKILGFCDGSITRLVTKSSMMGFGVNAQVCHWTCFVGLNDSWEQYYQAVRRFWRFGQAHPVDVHMIAAETEGNVIQNLRRKEADADRMMAAMVRHTSDISSLAVRGQVRDTPNYNPQKKMELPAWLAV